MERTNMERTIFVFFGLFAITLTAPVMNNNSEVTIVKYHNERTIDGYSFNYELSDGQEREETGTYKDGKDLNGVDIKVLTVTGHYSFIAPSGMKFTTYYIADENGYRVQKMMTETVDNRLSVNSNAVIKEDDADVAVNTPDVTTVAAEKESE